MTAPDNGLPRCEQQVGRAFVALADTLVDGYDVIDLLAQLVVHSVALLAADAAGLLLADAHEQLRVAVSSDEDSNTMELLARYADDGPCVECFHTAAQVLVPDLTLEHDRWPVFAAAVDRMGTYPSVQALPLRLRGQAIGVLALFGRRTGPLPAADVALGQALADVATFGILSERAIRRAEVVTEQLQTALDSRVLIEQAKGIVAQRTAQSTDAAFALLRGHARSHNLRIADLARQVVDRELDPLALSPVRDRGAG